MVFHNRSHHTSSLNDRISVQPFFFSTACRTIVITSLFVFLQPISDTWIKNVASSSSSSLVKYGTRPVLVPCFTQPESLSINLLANTLYILAALLAPMAPD